jgi:hypothetical protein
MKFGITYDADSEAGLDQVIFGLNDAFQQYFGDRFYDDSGVGLFVVLMCRDPRLDLKQRVRFVKKKNTLYIDIMLDLNMMSKANVVTRKRIVGEKMVNELPLIIAKHKFRNFDLQRFAGDLREWLETTGWIDPLFPELIEG